MLAHMSARPRLVPFLLSVVAMTGVAVFILTVGRVKQVTCTVRADRCSSELSQQLEKLYGQSLFFTDLTQLSSQLLESEIGYRVQAVSKEWPDQLSVQLEPQQVVYQLRLLGQDQFVSVTDLGWLIAQPQRNDVPLLIVTPEVWSSWQARGEVPLTLHEQFQGIPASVQHESLIITHWVLVDEQTIVLYLPTDQTVIIESASITSDLHQLNLLAKGVDWSVFSSPIQEIDLRYNLPVLRVTRNIPRHESL